MSELVLDKYEAVGNDFLLRVRRSEEPRLLPALVAALCDRHRGIGADGVLELFREPGGEIVTMQITNADGSFAETSGNGLRCAALAAVDHRLVDRHLVDRNDPSPSFLIVAGGVRSTVVVYEPGKAKSDVEVDMGRAAVSPIAQSPLQLTSAYNVQLANPHLVLIGEDFSDVDLSQVGPKLETAVPGGQNVELVRVLGRDELELAVWERGVGLTLACGSGSCAALAAAKHAGAVDDEVTVHNPGGALKVRLAAGESGTTFFLRGPARRIGRIRAELDDLMDELYT